MPVAARDPAAKAAIWSGWRGPLHRLPYLVIDLETTGLDPEHDRVIELAACGPDGLELTSLIDPGPEIEITGPHGLTAARLAGAPRFEALAWWLRKVLAGRIVVAHNAPFDLAFLQAEFWRLTKPLPALPYICTMDLARALALGHESRALAYACDRHGVSLLDAHTATGDVLATADLFRRYASRADAVGLDLDAIAHQDGSLVGAESWTLPPLQRPRPREFRPSLAALPRDRTAGEHRNADVVAKLSP
jgi:ATP-dependent DNA helicase PIF1